MSNKLYKSTGSGDGDYLKTSAHVVIESVDHIKTVIALGAGEFFVNSVNKHLRSHMLLVVHLLMHSLILFLIHSETVRKSVWLGFAIAFTNALLLCVYAAGWRLAAFLVIEERIGIVEVFRYMFLSTGKLCSNFWHPGVCDISLDYGVAFTLWHVCYITVE